MRTLRGAWRLLRCTGHVLHGLGVVLWRLPRGDDSARLKAVQWWSERLLQLLGAQLQVQGQFAPGPLLVVANHISWLDIMAMHSVFPRARFVSKADVQGWPVIARLVDAGGTLYIEREKRRDAIRVVHHMAEAMRAGDAVAVFPEGTTSDGRGLLPFHANLLQAAVVVGTPVQPVALRYADARHAISSAAEYIGDTTLLQSLWRLACADGLRVQVQVLAPEPVEGADRRALAQRLRGRIAQALGVPLEGAAP